MEKVRFAIYVYSARHDGELPASWDELVQYNTTNEYIRRHDPLRGEDILDRWGEPFAYESDGRNWYIIQSSGPDRTMGTADDVFLGEPQKYVDEAIRKAKEIPAVVRPETNAVQEVTAGAVQPPVGTKRVTPNRVPVTTKQPSSEPDETKNTPWKISLLLGVIILGAIVARWCFRKRKRR